MRYMICDVCGKVLYFIGNLDVDQWGRIILPAVGKEKAICKQCEAEGYRIKIERPGEGK